MKEQYPPFEFYEHTADILVVAYGKTIEELFENAALAVFEIMTDTSKVEQRVRRNIKSNGIDLENLLYRWIEDLLYYFDSEGLVFSKFKVYSIQRNNDEYILEGSVWGEEFDPSRHESRTLVKAITYAQMSINKINNMWKATFVVDI